MRYSEVIPWVCRSVGVRWGSRPLPEFMGEPDPINGGYGRYPRFSTTTRMEVRLERGQGFNAL